MSADRKFPVEKDLRPGDLAMASWIDAQKRPTDAEAITTGVRDEYRRQTGKRCDLVLIAVPAGRGKPFAQGIQESFITDPCAGDDEGSQP